MAFGASLRRAKDKINNVEGAGLDNALNNTPGLRGDVMMDGTGAPGGSPSQEGADVSLRTAPRRGFGDKLQDQLSSGGFKTSQALPTAPTPEEKPSALDRSKRLLEDITTGLDPVTQQLLGRQQVSGDARDAAERAAQRQRLEQRGVSTEQQEALGQQLQREQRQAETEGTRAIGEQLAIRQEAAIQGLAQIEQMESDEAKSVYNEVKENTDWTDPESVKRAEEAGKKAFGDDFSIAGFAEDQRRGLEIQAEQDFDVYVLDNINRMSTVNPETGAASYNYDDEQNIRNIQNLYDSRNPGGPYDFTADPATWSTAQKAYADGLMESAVKSAKAKEVEAQWNEFQQSQAYSNMSPDEQANARELYELSQELGFTEGYTVENIGGKTVLIDAQNEIQYVEGGSAEDIADFSGYKFIKVGDAYKDNSGRTISVSADGVNIDGVQFTLSQAMQLPDGVGDRVRAIADGSNIETVKEEAKVESDFEGTIENIKSGKEVTGEQIKALMENPETRELITTSAKPLADSLSDAKGGDILVQDGTYYIFDESNESLRDITTGESIDVSMAIRHARKKKEDSKFSSAEE